MTQTNLTTWSASQMLPPIALGLRWMLAGLYVFTKLNIGAVGLGWAIRPGFIVTALLVGIGTVELIKTKTPLIFAGAIGVIAALLVEFLPISRLGSIMLGFTINFIGNYVFFKNVNRVRLAEVMFLVVTAYIDSIFIYNLFQGEQMMFFFKQGWTI